MGAVRTIRGWKKSLGVYDPIGEYAKNLGLIVDDDVGAVDNSPGEDGELDIYDKVSDPERVKRYILAVTEYIPKGYQNLDKRIQEMETTVGQALEKMAKSLESMASAITTMGDNIVTLATNVNTLANQVAVLTHSQPQPTGGGISG